MTSWREEQAGSNGENVKTLQYLLSAHSASLTVDGSFGPLTTAAVKHFQGAHGLAADGIVGDHTWPALIIEVKSGSSGEAVKAVQSQINTGTASVHIGILNVDGVFGPKTDNAVRAFQTENQLGVDGIVGPDTWLTMVFWDGPGS